MRSRMRTHKFKSGRDTWPFIVNMSDSGCSEVDVEQQQESESAVPEPEEHEENVSENGEGMSLQ